MSHFVKATVLTLILSFAAGAAHALTSNYIGTNSTDWSDPGNWDNGVPSSGDTANITYGVYVKANRPEIYNNKSITIKNLNIKGTPGSTGTYAHLYLDTVGVTLTVTNSIHLTQAVILNTTRGSATLVIPASCTLTSNNADPTTNPLGFNVTEPFIQNDGQINVNSGDMAINGGGNNTGSISSLPAGTKFYIGLGTTLTDTGTLSGTIFDDGRLTENSALTFTGTMYVGGTKGGYIDGTGSLTCSGKLIFDSTTLNFGMVSIPTTVTGAGSIVVGSGAATGTPTFAANVTCDGSFSASNVSTVTITSGKTLTCGGTVTLDTSDFSGSGTLKLTALASMSSINALSGVNSYNYIFCHLNNAGSISVASGILEADNNGSNSGTMSATNPGTQLGFYASTFTNTGSLAGNVYLWSETLNINNALNFSGSLSLDVGPALDPLSSSTINGSGSLVASGSLQINGTLNASVSGDILDIPTTLVNSTAVVNAGGDLTCQNALTLNSSSINGAGTFILSSTGTLSSSTATANNINAVFNNSGSVAVSTGTLRINGGGSNFGGASMTAAPGTQLGFTTTLYHNLGALAGTTFVANTTLSLDAALAFSDTLIVDGGAGNPGTVGGAGPLTINAGGLIKSTASGDQLSVPTTVTTAAISVAASCSLTCNNSLTIDRSNINGTGTFVLNAATLTSMNASGVNLIDAVLTNLGSVSVTTGTLQIENSTGGSSSGSITMSGGTQLNFSNCTFADTGTISGGALSLAAASTLNVNATLSYAGPIGIANSTVNIASLKTLTCSGIVTMNNNANFGGAGTLAISNNLTSNNTGLGAASFNFIDCILNNTGTVNVTAGTLQIENSAGGSSSGSILFAGTKLNFSNCTFTDTGAFSGNALSLAAASTLNVNTSLTFTGSIDVTGSTVNIAVSKTLTCSGIVTMNNKANFGGAGTLANSNSLTSHNTNPGAASFNFIDCILNNTGAVSVTAGTLQVENSSGGTSSGSLTISSGAQLGFANSSFAITAGTLSGGTVYVSNDILSINTIAPLAYDGTLILDGGAGNPGTITGSGSLAITGLLQSNAIGDQLNINTTVTNAAIGVAASSSMTCNNALTIDRSNLNGAGTFALSGTGTMNSVNANVGFPIADNFVHCVFNNAGIVTVVSGTLEFDGGGTNSGSMVNSGSQLGFFTTSYVNAPGGTLSGTVYVASTTLLVNNALSLNGPLHLDGSPDRSSAPGTIGGVGSLNLSGALIVAASGDSLNVPAILNSVSVNNGSLILNANATCNGAANITTGSISIAAGKTLICNNSVSMNNNGNLAGLGTLSIALVATLTSNNTNGASSVNFVDCVVNNAGSISITNGSLQIENSSAGFSSGSITMIGATQLNFAGCTFANAGTIGGGGISMTAATLNVNALLTYGGAVGIANSSINVAGGQTLTCNGAVTLGAAAGFGGTGTLAIGTTGSLSGVGSINCNLINSGTIGTGAAAGTLMVGANFTQNASGTLNIKVGGRLPGQWDQVKLTGAASSTVLGGTLNVSLINGFFPTITDAFDILTFASESGTFASVVDGGSGLVPVYGVDRVTLAKGPPVITSPASATGVLGQAFSYTITANAPATFAIIGVLPAGLTSNANTIFGTPTQLGIFNVTLTATNILGTGTLPLTITINPPAPVINSALTASGIVGTAFTYKITATDSPASFSAGNLPPGLALASNTISGTPTAPGTFNVALGATNVTGTGAATLVVTIVAPIGPAITSALTANAAVGQAFSYTITASGNGQISFGAAPLPPGLAFAVDTISGTPSVAGAIDITLTASNFSGSDSKTLRLIIAHADGSSDTPPALASAPTATPNPALAGQAVVFSAAASDADGDLLAYTWDFGDGIGASGSSPSHVYAAGGIYTATVTVTDGLDSVSGSVDVAVNTTAVSNLTQYAILKAQIKFNFVQSGKDSVLIQGTLPLPMGFAPSGKNVSVNVGGFHSTSTLNSKGMSADKRFKMAGKAKNGVFTASPAKFAFSVKNSDLYSKLKALGFTQAAGSHPVTIDVAISIGDENMIAASTLNYTVKVSKGTAVSGTAKK